MGASGCFIVGIIGVSSGGTAFAAVGGVLILAGIVLTLLRIRWHPMGEYERIGSAWDGHLP
jgi:hypothetical protein